MAAIYDARSINSGLVDKVATAGLTGLIDGGYTDVNGVGQAVAAGATEVGGGYPYTKSPSRWAGRCGVCDNSIAFVLAGTVYTTGRAAARRVVHLAPAEKVRGNLRIHHLARHIARATWCIDSRL